MIRSTRLILFYSLTFLFLLATPIILFYARGYRFDFKRRAFVETGAFSFKSNPKRAKIYINDKLLKKKTPALVKGLLPRDYFVRVEKHGFHTWEKRLTVEEGLVTEAGNILLVPQDLEKELLEIKVENFYLSPDGKKIAYLAFNKKQEIELKILDLENKKPIPSPLIQYPISSIQWSQDSQKILFSTKIKDNTEWIIVEIKEPPKSLDLSGIISDLRSPISNLQFHPSDSSKLFFLQEDNLHLLDIVNKTFSLVLENIENYTLNSSNIFFIQGPNHTLYRTNLQGEGKEQIAWEPLPHPRFEVLISSRKEIVLLGDQGGLYLLDKKEKKLEKIAQGVKEAKFSPHSDKLLYRTYNEIWVYWLKDVYTQPFKKAGDKELITRFSEEIEQAIWYPYLPPWDPSEIFRGPGGIIKLPKHYSHIIFAVGDKIKITELDSRDKRNAADLFDAKNPRLIYNEDDRKLYFLDGENLYSSKLF